MDDLEVSNILGEFASLPRAFPIHELIDMANSGIEERALENALRNDTRFVSLAAHSRVCDSLLGGEDESSEEFFVRRRALLRWFVALNLRLDNAAITEITADQFAESVSRLRLEGQWDCAPSPAVDFGMKLGLIATSLNTDRYVFPLVYLFSRLPPIQRQIATYELANLVNEVSPHRWLRKPIQYWVREGLSKFDPHTVSLVERREGFRGGGTETLDAIGSDLGVTRERIRQITAKFWKRLSERPSLQIPFIRGLVFEVMRRQGRLVFNSQIAPMRFVAKCSMLPSVELSHNGYLVLGALPEDIASAKPLMQEGKTTQLLSKVSQLATEGKICLSDSDFKTFLERAENLVPRGQRKGTRLRQALLEIGKPAHYSEVAEKYKELFPDDQTSDHAIHAILSREKYGIVWIGVKGTFALKEWGYERPTQTLFESVAEIVEKVFAQTGKPVPFRVITAEISRYRKLVSISSLTIATQFNPKLHRTGDSYLPIDERDHEADENEYSDEYLDKILEGFRNATTPKSSALSKVKPPRSHLLRKKKQARRKRT